MPECEPEFDLTVSDLGRDALSAVLTITDAGGQTVRTNTWPIKVDPAKPWTNHATLTPLAAGYYTATLDVRGAKSLIARAADALSGDERTGHFAAAVRPSSA